MHSLLALHIQRPPQSTVKGQQSTEHVVAAQFVGPSAFATHVDEWQQVAGVQSSSVLHCPAKTPTAEVKKINAMENTGANLIILLLLL